VQSAMERNAGAGRASLSSRKDLESRDSESAMSRSAFTQSNEKERDDHDKSALGHFLALFRPSQSAKAGRGGDGGDGEPLFSSGHFGESASNSRSQSKSTSHSRGASSESESEGGGSPRSRMSASSSINRVMEQHRNKIASKVRHYFTTSLIPPSFVF
jgi:hypothetical protein